MTVRINVRDHQLQAWARRAPGEADRAVREFLTIAGPVVVRHMRRATRVFKHPRGHLRGSIRWHRRGKYTIRVQPNVPYADWVNYPTRAHEIRAKNGKALTIPMAGGILGSKRRRGTSAPADGFGPTRKRHAVTTFRFGIRKAADGVGPTYGGKTTRAGVHLRSRVWHPGTRGHFFVEKAAATARPDLDMHMRIILQRRMR